jgi:hypothetical protein
MFSSSSESHSGQKVAGRAETNREQGNSGSLSEAMISAAYGFWQKAVEKYWSRIDFLLRW